MKYDVTYAALGVIRDALETLRVPVTAEFYDDLAGGCFGHQWHLSDGRVLLVTFGEGDPKLWAPYDPDFHRVVVSLYQSFDAYAEHAGEDAPMVSFQPLTDPTDILDDLLQ